MDKKGENFSLLFFVSGSLKREDGSRIATPHSLIKERFTRYGVRASVVAVSNECFVARVSDAVLCSVQNFGETLRVSERLPKAGDCIYVIVKLTFSNNGTGRKPRKYHEGDCLVQFLARSGLETVEGTEPLVTSHPDQLRQGVKIIGVNEIKGTFKVISVERFQEALSEGIGARRSYGFGFMRYEIITTLDSAESARGLSHEMRMGFNCHLQNYNV